MCPTRKGEPFLWSPPAPVLGTWSYLGRHLYLDALEPPLHPQAPGLGRRGQGLPSLEVSSAPPPPTLVSFHELFFSLRRKTGSSPGHGWA